MKVDTFALAAHQSFGEAGPKLSPLLSDMRALSVISYRYWGLSSLEDDHGLQLQNRPCAKRSGHDAHKHDSRAAQ